MMIKRAFSRGNRDGDVLGDVDVDGDVLNDLRETWKLSQLLTQFCEV